MFSKMDKKLTKNLLKRCMVDPLTERLLARQHHVKASTVPDAKPITELEAYHADDKETLAKFHNVIKMLLRQHAMLTPTLRENLVHPL